MNIINKILRYPEKMPCDKRMHFIIGVLWMSVAMLVMPMYASIVLLVILAWGIEFYQKYTKSGTYDNYDAIAVVIGGLIVMLPYLSANT